MARFNRSQPGPRPVRYRGAKLWGIDGLTPSEEWRVKEANVLMIHFLALCESVSRLGGIHLLEHPADPGVDPYPSIFACEVLIELEARVGARRIRIDQ